MDSSGHRSESELVHSYERKTQLPKIGFLKWRSVEVDYISSVVNSIGAGEIRKRLNAVLQRFIARKFIGIFEHFWCGGVKKACGRRLAVRIVLIDQRPQSLK